MADDKSFLGRGWNFPPEFGRNENTTRMVDDEENIRQSLITLFSTRTGERFNRRFGCELEEFVNEPITETLMSLMKKKIERAILLNEPRIELNGIRFDRSRERDGLLNIQLNYVIRQTNTADNVVYPFYLKQ